MEQETVVFRKGDVIVSGRGNMGIFNGVVDGFIGDRFTADLESSAPAGTDLRYARHATEAEKKFFFDALKENGLVWNPDEFTVKPESEDWRPSLLHEKGRVNWRAEGMHPFKVVTGEKKKRVRPTWKQVHELEAALAEQDVLINRANKVHEEGLVALRNAKEAIESLRKKVNELMIENERLRNRSFLERVFNK